MKKNSRVFDWWPFRSLKSRSVSAQDIQTRLESWFSHNLSHHRSVARVVLYPDNELFERAIASKWREKRTGSFFTNFSCSSSDRHVLSVSLYVRRREHVLLVSRTMKCEIKARSGTARLNHSKSRFLLTDRCTNPLLLMRLAHARPASKRERAWTGNRHTHQRNAVLCHVYVAPPAIETASFLSFFQYENNFCYLCNL